MRLAAWPATMAATMMAKESDEDDEKRMTLLRAKARNLVAAVWRVEDEGVFVEPALDVPRASSRGAGIAGGGIGGHMRRQICSQQGGGHLFDRRRGR